MKKRWLKDWPRETVVTINAALCKEKNALHKPTTDGYKHAQKLWEDACRRELTLREAIEIGRRCHKLSPFCFYNGNIFAAIGRTIIQEIKLAPAKAHSFRSVVGHYIAGTIGDDELDQALKGLEYFYFTHTLTTRLHGPWPWALLAARRNQYFKQLYGWFSTGTKSFRSRSSCGSSVRG